MSTKMRNLINLCEGSSADTSNQLKRMVTLYSATNDNIFSKEAFDKFERQYLNKETEAEVTIDIEDMYNFIPEQWWDKEDLSITFYITDINYYYEPGSHSPHASSPEEFYGTDELEFFVIAFAVSTSDIQPEVYLSMFDHNDQEQKSFLGQIEQELRHAGFIEPDDGH